MDVEQFDALARAASTATSRRQLMVRVAGVLLAMRFLHIRVERAAADDSVDAGACRRNQHGAHAKCRKDSHCCTGVCYQRACCDPEDFFMTCDGKCGLVENNCGQRVDCGFFCGECQICPTSTHICEKKPRGTSCGEPGSGRCCLDGLCSPDSTFCVSL